MRVFACFLAVSLSLAVSAQAVPRFSNRPVVIDSGPDYRLRHPLPDATNLSGFGVNVHYPSELTDAELDKMEQVGVKWVRIPLYWDQIENRPNRYSFGPFDAAFARLSKRRIKVIGVLGYGHPTYTGGAPPVSSRQFVPFGRYVRATVSRYAGKGYVWEIWNEANYAVFWPGTNPEQYVSFARRTTAAIRSVAPREWVVGVSGVFPNSSDDTWFPRAFQAGLLNDVDAISMHPYVSPHLVPETREASWRWLRDLIQLHKPAGKNIPVLSTEGGFSRADASMTPVRRGRELTRYVLGSLASGVGMINVFNWIDLDYDPNPRNMRFGLYDQAGAEQPGLAELRRVMGGLKGWRFSKRLLSSSPNDYVLLFERDNQVRLATWTSDAPHNIQLDASPGTMDLQTESSSTEISTSGGKLTIPLGNDVRMVTPQTENPLLVVAAQWSKAPAEAAIGSVADAKAAFQQVLVSPAWQDAPVGSTLRIDDVPDDQPGYARASYTRTYSALGGLSPTDSNVTSLWATLPCIQDGTEGARTVRFTLTLPDGSAVSQATRVVPVNPLKVEYRAPNPLSFSLWARNPSGKAFMGEIEVVAGPTTIRRPLAFSAGETEREIVFEGTTPALGANGVETKLFSGMAGVRDPDLPVVATRPVCVEPLAQPDSSRWSVSKEGLGIAGLLFERTSDTAIDDPMEGLSHQFEYRLSGTLWAAGHLLSTPRHAVTQRQFALGMWVKGEGDRVTLSSTFMDAQQESWQTAPIEVDWIGWRWVTLRCDTFASRWSGDGVIQYPLSLRHALSVTPGALAATNRSLRVQGITLLSTPNP